MSDFDDAAAYDAQLDLGLRLSGEGKGYFAAGRLAALRRLLPGPPPRSVLDFGCGIGDTAVALGVAFPGASVVGADEAEGAIAHARKEHAASGVEFVRPTEIAGDRRFDLVYVNGVFHHIAPGERQETVDWIRQRLAPGGHLAFFENNPWNPGARLVMRRVPFDRDARMLAAPEAAGLLRRAGLLVVRRASLFWFPRWLAVLRPAERWLEGLPLGAQYLVLARAPGGGDAPVA